MDERIYQCWREKITKTRSNTGILKAGAVALLENNAKDKARLRVAEIIDQIKEKDGSIIWFKILLRNSSIIERTMQKICDLSRSHNFKGTDGVIAKTLIHDFKHKTLHHQVCIFKVCLAIFQHAWEG